MIDCWTAENTGNVSIGWCTIIIKAIIEHVLNQQFKHNQTLPVKQTNQMQDITNCERSWWSKSAWSTCSLLIGSAGSQVSSSSPARFIGINHLTVRQLLVGYSLAAFIIVPGAWLVTKLHLHICVVAHQGWPVHWKPVYLLGKMGWGVEISVMLAPTETWLSSNRDTPNIQKCSCFVMTFIYHWLLR